MNILVISQNFYPDNFQINQIVKSWETMGINVTVLTSLGDYTTGYTNPKYLHHKNYNESYYGSCVHRVYTIPRHKGAFWRSLNYLSFVLSSSFWSMITKKKFDIVYVYELSPVTQIIPAIIYSYFHNHIPIAVYVLDIWPESVKAMDIKENTLLFFIIHKLSAFLYKHVSGLAVSSPSFKKYLCTVDDVKNKIIFIPQYHNILNLDNAKLAFKKLNDVTDFVFTGNIGLAQDLETVVLAVNYLVKCGLGNKFRVHLVGYGSDFNNLLRMVHNNKLDKNIIFYGRQPYCKMINYYKAADACLLTLSGKSKIGLTIPSKLQAYMSSGKPIIAAIDGDAQKIIKNSNCGFYTNAGNYIGLAKKIVEFIRLPNDKKSKLGENGKNYFIHHYLKKQFNIKTLEWMSNLIKKNNYLKGDLFI